MPSLKYWDGSAWQTLLGSSISDSQLPARLRAVSPQVTDYNNALDNGWYWGLPSCANTPVAQYCAVRVDVLNSPTQVRQEAWAYPTMERYSRYRIDGNWSAWVQTYPINFEAGLPARLQQYSFQPADLNTEVTNGWRFANGAANAPPSAGTNQWLIQVIAWGSASYCKQIAYGLYSDEVWQRRWYTAWSSWTQMYPAVSSGSEIDYASITANVNCNSPGNWTNVISGNSRTFDGGRVRMEFWCPGLTQTGGTNNMYIGLARDGSIAWWELYATGINRPFTFVAYDTPPAGGHYYGVYGQPDPSGPNGIVRAGTGGPPPAFLRITKA